MIQENIINKKLNIILPGIGDSGGIQVIKQYQNLLTELGWDVIIYCPIKSYNLHRYNSRLKNLFHQVYCTSKAIFEKKYKKDVKWVWKVCDKSIRDADVTMATMWATAYDVNKLSSYKGKKYYFIQGFEIWDNKKWGLDSYKLPLEKIVVSTWINNQLNRELHIGPFPVVYNGIDTDIFNSNERTKHEGITFLMLNHKLDKKGVKQGLEVFYKIHNKYPNTKLRMFGMCSNDNIPSDIEYFRNPSKETILFLYRDTDIFIYPSLEEGWGLTPIEAMACGCAVVGTRTGFVLDLGKHLENMMISEPGDVDTMVSNIVVLIEDKKLFANIITKSKNTVSKLTWGNSADIFTKYLHRSMISL